MQTNIEILDHDMESPDFQFSNGFQRVTKEPQLMKEAEKSMTSFLM